MAEQYWSPERILDEILYGWIEYLEIEFDPKEESPTVLDGGVDGSTTIAGQTWCALEPDYRYDYAVDYAAEHIVDYAKTTAYSPEEMVGFFLRYAPDIFRKAPKSGETVLGVIGATAVPIFTDILIQEADKTFGC